MDNDKIKKIGESKEAITATAAQYAQYLANLQKESEIKKLKKEEGEDPVKIKDKVDLQSIKKADNEDNDLTNMVSHYGQQLDNLLKGKKESEIREIKKSIEEAMKHAMKLDSQYIQSLMQNLKKAANNEEDWTTPPDLQHFPPKEASGGIELNLRPYNKRGVPTVGIPADSGKVGPNPSFKYPEPKIKIELPESAIKEKIENLKKQIKGTLEQGPNFKDEC